MHVNPDLTWYTTESERRSLPVRCPFAATSRCPRYFQSLALLGESGFATKIPADEKKRLTELWSKSGLLPTVAEQATSVSGWEGSASHFANFCPEVAFTAFKFFASYLSRFADEADRDLMYKALVMSGVAGAGDWRWTWAHVEELHYSACPMYSLLQVKPTSAVPAEGEREVFLLRPSIWGIGIDLKRLVAVTKSWWKRKRAI